MGISAIAGPVLGIAGGLISGSKESQAAKGQAEALRAAADKASAMAQFNPYGMTTNFGTSTFADGRGSYTLSPELQASQQRLFGQLNAYDPSQIGMAAQPLMGGASTLFGRGAEYLGQSPEQVSAKFIADQQALLQPSRAADFARLNSTNFGRGTTGLAVNTGTGGAPSNPAAQALFNAQARQDLELASRADQAAMDRTRFGASLFGTGGELVGQVPRLTTAGYAPTETQLNLLRTTESMGQDPFKLSADLANQYATSGARAGQLYLEPQAAAAAAYRQYQGYSPMGTALSGAGSAISPGGSAGSWFSGLFGSSGGKGFTDVGGQGAASNRALAEFM
jgi:hypothetical protein